MKVILDSSGWIELLADAGRGHLFEPALHEELLVPSIVRYEVERYTLHRGPSGGTKAAIQALQKFKELPLDGPMASTAAQTGHRYRLAAADALIYAIARTQGAELWTQDAHFKELPGVRYFPKPAA